jgi:hypothetical protein
VSPEGKAEQLVLIHLMVVATVAVASSKLLGTLVVVLWCSEVYVGTHIHHSDAQFTHTTNTTTHMCNATDLEVSVEVCFVTGLPILSELEGRAPRNTLLLLCVCVCVYL